MQVEREHFNNRKKPTRFSLVHMAAKKDDVKMAALLLKNKRDPDIVSKNGFTPLHIAAHYGSIRIAKLLLDKGANVNFAANQNITPLHVASKYGHLQMANLLFSYGAQIHCRTLDSLTPLHCACRNGQFLVVKFLLAKGALINAKTKSGLTPLHMAAQGGHVETALTLIKKKARIDALSLDFLTPLHVAAHCGNVGVCKLLLDYGANITAKAQNGFTPLHIACKRNQGKIVELLIKYEEIDSNETIISADTEHGVTPLHLAAKFGHLDLVKVLVERIGVDINITGKNQLTPLHSATQFDRKNVVMYLLEKGASPRANTENKYTCLHIAAKWNYLTVAAALLQYGADPNASSIYGFTPLHFASKNGHIDMISLLLQNNSDPNMSAYNGVTSMHACALEDQVHAARILKAFGAKLDTPTVTGYTPLHIACYFARVNMVRFLLRYGAKMDLTTKAGCTALHQAAQRGCREIVEILLPASSPNLLPVDCQTPLARRRFGYKNGLDSLIVRDNFITGRPDDCPEIMQAFFDTAMENEGEDASLNGHSPKKEKFANIEKAADLHRASDGLVQVNGEKKKMDPNDQAQLEKIIEREQQRSTSGGTAVSLFGHQNRQLTGSPLTITDGTDLSVTAGSVDYQIDGHYLPDNVDISAAVAHGGFLISFLVDARGGAMRGCRHSGVRIIIPPRKAPMPMRITCRYLRKEKLVHPPTLSEGEALASRILEMGPAGAKFLGPVILEIPHFAALRNREREVMIIRSDDGEHWKEHQLEATEDAVQEVLNESFDPEELSQLDDLQTTRITRILTNDFPQYFAVVTRIRQEVHAVGPEGGMIGSTVVPQVKAIFPEGALTKTIKVSLQAQPITQELVTKLHGSRVAVSPIVTVEPRRRKFHKPITLCIPLPPSPHKSIFVQQQMQQQGVAAPTQKEEDQKEPPPTLRLLCSITGGTSPAKWEDITGTTQLAFSTEHVSFTTTVSARFWLMDCHTPKEAARMAQEIYNEAILTPYMAKFVVFARRTLPNEWQLRVFCMTDDKEDKTLERQEHYTEIAKSRDVEVSATRQQHVEFSGNIIPVLKSGEQLNLRFVPFQENRLMFSMKKKETEGVDAPAAGRIAFVKDPKFRSEMATHQHPICTLAIALPITANLPATDAGSVGSQSSNLPRKYRFSKTNLSETLPNSDISIQDLARDLGPDCWQHLGRALNVSDDDLRYVQREYYGQETPTILRIWIERDGQRATLEKLEAALRQLGREDVMKKRLHARVGLWNGQKGFEKAGSVDSDGSAAIPTISEEVELKKPKI